MLAAGAYRVGNLSAKPRLHKRGTRASLTRPRTALVNGDRPGGDGIVGCESDGPGPWNSLLFLWELYAGLSPRPILAGDEMCYPRLGSWVLPGSPVDPVRLKLRGKGERWCESS